MHFARTLITMFLLYLYNKYYFLFILLLYYQFMHSFNDACRVQNYVTVCKRLVFFWVGSKMIKIREPFSRGLLVAGRQAVHTNMP